MTKYQFINAALTPSNSLDGRGWAMLLGMSFVVVGAIGASRHEVKQEPGDVESAGGFTTFLSPHAAFASIT